MTEIHFNYLTVNFSPGIKLQYSNTISQVYLSKLKSQLQLDHHRVQIDEEEQNDKSKKIAQSPK